MMTALSARFFDISTVLRDTRREPAIDVLKGLCIIAVIAQHTLADLGKLGAAFWAFPAMPIFMVLFGLNSYSSASKRDDVTLCAAFRTTLNKRLVRLGLPIAITWTVSAILGVMQGQSTYGPLTLIGMFPTPGAGNYFVGVIVGATLFFPVLLRLFHSRPITTSVCVVAVDAGFSLLGPYLSELHRSGNALYYAAFLRYLTAIVVGMWIARVGARRFLHSQVIGALVAISMIYLALTINNASLFPWWLHDFTLATNFGAAPYAAALVALACIAPRHWWLQRPWYVIRWLGLASFHIFLAQVLWTASVTGHSAVQFAAALVASCVIGVVFFVATLPIRRHEP